MDRQRFDKRVGTDFEWAIWTPFPALFLVISVVLNFRQFLVSLVREGEFGRSTPAQADLCLTGKPG